MSNESQKLYVVRNAAGAYFQNPMRAGHSWGGAEHANRFASVEAAARLVAVYCGVAEIVVA